MFRIGGSGPQQRQEMVHPSLNGFAIEQLDVVDAIQFQHPVIGDEIEVEIEVGETLWVEAGLNLKTGKPAVELAMSQIEPNGQQGHPAAVAAHF